MMTKNNKAKEPFRFYTRYSLAELTGLKASNLAQLLGNIKKVETGSIYHHTHRFLQQHQYLSPEPPNDFAFWISEVLEEKELGERLASIDTVQFPNIRSLREKIVSVIEEYMSANSYAKRKFAKKGEEFHFISSRSFVIPTNHVAGDLKEFIAILKFINVHSIYYHIFESRLRLDKPTNDFSNWLEDSLGLEEMAHQISRLDPYTHTLEDLRKNIITILKSGNNSKWQK